MSEVHGKIYGYLTIAIGIFAVILHKIGIEFIDTHLLLLMTLILAIFLLLELLKRAISINEVIVRTLMVFVGVTLFIFNLHFEGILLLTMYGFAEVLESIIEGYAEKKLRKLLEVIPRTVKMLKDNKITIIDVENVREGDLVIVGKGERIPVDGIVFDGEALIDESTITGEPKPRKIRVYDEVLAGGLVLSGAIKVRATKPGSESLISRIVKLVEKYKERKAKIETVVHKFSRIYLLAMLASATIAWFTLGYYKALIFIAVGCPSAFLVTIPATLLASVSVYSKKGIIVKGTKPIEAASKVRVVAFDKTGTLTLGKLVLEKIIKLENRISEKDIIKYVASLEVYSNHPIAKAVVEEAKKRNINLLPAFNVIEKPSLGIEGIVLGKYVFVGKAEHSELIKYRSKEHSLIKELNGKIIAQLKIDGKTKAFLIFSDRINPESKAVMDELRKLKLKTIMITGDKKVNALKVAKQLNINNVYAELKPEDKVRVVKEIKKELAKNIAMVGDGINDTPALAAADLGIAVGNLEAVGEAGDLVISRGGINLVPFIFKFAKFSMKKVYENIIIVLLAKLTAITLGALGVIPLWTAVALGDDGGAILSLLNIAFILKARVRG